MNKNIISLEGMCFRALHGYYAHERENGNEFVVDVHLTTDFSKAAATDSLSNTLNYETIYTITKKEMAIPSKLLESVAERILSRLYGTFRGITCITVSVAKKNPPVGGAVGQSKVTIVRSK